MNSIEPTELGKKVEENLKRNAERIVIDRVPSPFIKDFKQLAFQNFAGDYGMAFKSLWEERINLLNEVTVLRQEKSTNEQLRELLDLLKTLFQTLAYFEDRLKAVEDNSVEQPKKTLKMASGREIEVNRNDSK